MRTSRHYGYIMSLLFMGSAGPWGGCVIEPPETAPDYRLLVNAHGLFTPVTISLHHESGRESLRVTEDGHLWFAHAFQEGDTYSVTLDRTDLCFLEDETGTVTRRPMVVSLDCPSLDDLQVSAVSDLGFDPRVMNYTFDVGFLQEDTTILPRAHRADFEVQINGRNFVNDPREAILPLGMGAQDIAIDVRHPASGAGRTYQVTLDRKINPAELQLSPSEVPRMQDEWGRSIAFAASQGILAVGVPGFNPNDGTDGPNRNNAGTVFLFVREDNAWRQIQRLSSDLARDGDRFGWSVALSADGGTLAIGVIGENHGATGVNADVTMFEDAYQSGAVYIFARTGNSWTQDAYIKPHNTGSGDNFGYSVALSDSGNTLVVGAYREAGSMMGVNPVSNDGAPDSGAVYVFERTLHEWAQTTYLKPSNTDAGDRFGFAVAVSSTGNTIVVGADRESSQTSGVNGDPDDNSDCHCGAVYIFARTSDSWEQCDYLKGFETDGILGFGTSLALSTTGHTLVVGARGGENNPGAAYVFRRTLEGWKTQQVLQASNEVDPNWFGQSVALSSTENLVLVGAPGRVRIGEGKPPEFNGAVYLFTWDGEQWVAQEKLTASTSSVGDTFGWSVALSNTENTLAVGAYLEDYFMNGVQDTGAVYLFE